MRVHELAKKYKVSSKEIIDMLALKGIEAANHMASVSEKGVALVAKKFDKKKETKKVKKGFAKGAVKQKKVKEETKVKTVKKEKKKTKVKTTKEAKKEKEIKAGKKEKKIKTIKPASQPLKKEDETELLKEEVVKEVLATVEDTEEASLGIEEDDNLISFEKIETKSKKRESPKLKGVKKKEKVKGELQEKIIRTNFPIVLKNLAAKMEVSPSEVISKLLKLGIIASINQELDEDTALILAEDFGFTIEKVSLVLQQKFSIDIEEEEDKPGDLKVRAPVVTLMGHVDHGKTSLLDCVRNTSVVSSESGGITQHIGAYEVLVNQANKHSKITFLDTPGHEAFTSMRARGANVTDICVLVVAADDGVMPQTVEAISHIKAAKAAVIVAINKIDRPNAQLERVKNQLAQHEFIPEDWGGDTIVVETSAETKQGIDHLLEMIVLQAEMLELKANPTKKAKGAVIEAKLTKGKGPTATILVQNGTLEVGDYVVCGLVCGKIKAMTNYKGEVLYKAGPSVPVEILGLTEVPSAGDMLYVVGSEKETKFVSEARKRVEQQKDKTSVANVTLDDLYQQMADNRLQELKLIVKADVQGSLEALSKVIGDLKCAEVKVKIIHNAVGSINESDVMLARASNALIIGFRVKLESSATGDLCKREGVIVRFYDVIYNVVGDIKDAMEGLLEPEKQENIIGHAEVRKIFKVSKLGMIAGCMVQDGKIVRNAKARVKRDDNVLIETSIASLKRFQDEVKEVPNGAECGIRLNNFNDFEEQDIIEVFVIEEKKRRLT